MAYSSYQSPRRNRKSIRQKNSLSGSSGASPSPWKDALKAKCLERARAKRIHTMNQKRTAFTSPQNSAFVQNTPGEAYSCNNSDGHHYDASDSAATGINTAVSPKNTARQVVQEQLQATGVRIFPSSAVKENALFPTPTKNTTANMNLSMNSNTNNLMKPRFSPIPQLSTAMFSPSGSNCSLIPQIPSTPMIDYSIHNDNTCNEHNAVANGENWISEDELYELMQEVEEELLLEQG
jgi:nitrite reductase/ring-hydroxylating ferredoxin subunit